MSKLLSEAVDISELGQRQFWVVYGKSGSGKTNFISSFPKPLLYLQIGDDGSNTISEVEGIKAIKIRDLAHLKAILLEARLDKTYASVVVDTFSLVVNEWIDQNAVKKNKKVSMPMWGDIKTETEEFIKLLHILSETKVVVATCHEVTDAFEGMEDEITPDIRPNVSKGARTYLESMANFGIHTTIISKLDDNGKEQYRFAAHLGQNPYYWVKTQKPASVRLPKLVYNPTFDKIMKILKGEK